MRRLAALLLLILALPAWAGDWLGMGDVVWRDDRGKTTRLGDWRGKPVLLTMAYSRCRKICSVTLQTLQDIQRRADERGIAIEVVVVSLDPRTDTPATWAQYRRKHRLDRAAWTFLSGRTEDSARLAKALGIEYWLYDDHVMHDFKIVRIEDGTITHEMQWDDRRPERLLP